MGFITLKRFRVVMHVHSLVSKKFYENNINGFLKTFKIKAMSRWTFFLNFAYASSYFEIFCTKKRLCNIFEVTNAKILTKNFLESH